MDYDKWIAEIKDIVIDDYDEDTWDRWEFDDEAWQELFEQDYDPIDAIEEYKRNNI